MTPIAAACPRVPSGTCNPSTDLDAAVRVLTGVRADSAGPAKLAPARVHRQRAYASAPTPHSSRSRRWWRICRKPPARMPASPPNTGLHVVTTNFADAFTCLAVQIITTECEHQSEWTYWRRSAANCSAAIRSLISTDFSVRSTSDA